MNTHGNHTMVDFQYNPDDLNLGPEILMELCYEYINEAITGYSNMKIVDRRKHLFDEPPGFTIFYCLDESHCSVHSYTDKGLLSFDCYTCGPTNPEKIMEIIRIKLEAVIPSLETRFNHTVKRFHYNLK